MTYLITCLKCRAERKIKLVPTPVGKRIDWIESADNANHPICSGRQRLDGEMGFQCRCGNNDLMTKQELRTIKNPVSPKPEEIEKIVSGLIPQKPKFAMVEA